MSESIDNALKELADYIQKTSLRINRLYGQLGLGDAGDPPTAATVSLTTTNFNNMLTTSENTIQKALDRIDNLRWGNYVPITPRHAIDTAGNTWGGAGLAGGNYTFRREDNSLAWPTDAVALQIFLYGLWNDTFPAPDINVGGAVGTATEQVKISGLVDGIGYATTGNVSLDGLSRFYASIWYATNTTVLRILGYYRKL